MRFPWRFAVGPVDVENQPVLQSELVDGRRLPSYEQAEHETLHWISFYNLERLQEELGDLPPVEYEESTIKTDSNAMVSAT